MQDNKDTRLKNLQKIGQNRLKTAPCSLLPPKDCLLQALFISGIFKFPPILKIKYILCLLHPTYFIYDNDIHR